MLWVPLSPVLSAACAVLPGGSLRGAAPDGPRTRQCRASSRAYEHILCALARSAHSALPGALLLVTLEYCRAFIAAPKLAGILPVCAFRVAARVSACHSLRRSQAACTFQLHAFVAQAFAFVLSCSCAPCAATLTRVELKELRARPRQPLRSRAGAADTAPYPIATPPQAQALAISSGSCSATPTASGSRHGRG